MVQPIGFIVTHESAENGTDLCFNIVFASMESARGNCQAYMERHRDNPEDDLTIEWLDTTTGAVGYCTWGAFDFEVIAVYAEADFVTEKSS